MNCTTSSLNWRLNEKIFHVKRIPIPAPGQEALVVDSPNGPVEILAMTIDYDRGVDKLVEVGLATRAQDVAERGFVRPTEDLVKFMESRIGVDKAPIPTPPPPPPKG